MNVTPRVKDVKALDDKCIYVKFEDGKERIYNMSTLIETNEFYSRLKNKEYFKLVKPRGVTVQWPNGEDVCPEDLYGE